MGLRINTNIQALNAHKNLTKTDNMLSSSLERLSSGLRINRAADDASGLAIADNLRAQYTGIGQAVANANDGVNIIQIADGALEESLNIVNTIRTKAIQAASDAQSDASRGAIQADVDKLLEELNMIADSTAYNGINLLDGSFVDKQFHIGAYKDESVKINIGNASGEVVGAMASAKTERITEGAVSSPLLRGNAVNADKLSAGDVKLNGVEIGSSLVQDANVGTKSTAWAKAAAINAKVNETGVQAKATSELIVSVGAALSGASLNNVVAFSAATNGAQLVSLINNNQSYQEMGIRAEALKGQAVKIVAEDGRNLSLHASSDLAVNGMNMSATGNRTYEVRGTLTLSNARAMVTTDDYIKSGTINSGDLVINGIDVARGGSLTITRSDDDKTLLNAINNNEDLQRLGIRAERISLDGGTEHRIRLISDSQEINISGIDPSVASLTAGTTKGVETSGILLEGNTVDTDTSKDNYLDKLGFGGTKYGTFEDSGVNNVGGNDKAVISKAYLQGSTVNADKMSAGDLRINGVEIGSSLVQAANVGTKSTAWSKAAAINAKVNETGVQAKATSELIVSVGAALSGASLNNVIEFSTVTDGATLVSLINNNQSYQEMGIRAEALKGNAVKITAEDGRNLSLKASGDLYVNGAELSGAAMTVRGTLTLSNARAMVTTDDYIKSGTMNAGDLTINGVDLAASGSLTLTKSDDDKTLLNAINSNEELQKMGIRAERISFDGGTEHRIRLISESEEITIGGANPSIAGFKQGTTEGIVKTGIELSGNPVDTDTSKDNYLDKIGLAGANIDGATEETGENNSGANDRMMFGNDRLSYDAGDVSINGTAVGETGDDGLSDVMGDKSAAAWAESVNSMKDSTGVEADIIKATKTGAGMVTEGILQQGDIKINGIDIVRDNTSGSGMEVYNGDSGNVLIDAINEYKDQTGVIASKSDDGKNLVLTARDGRNIHVETTSNGNKVAKFAADFGKSGVAQDSVYFGNIRLVSDEQFTVDGAGSSASAREISLMKLGLAGGTGTTGATSDMKGDGTILSGLDYKTAIGNVDVTTQEGANLAIRTADYAIKRLDEIRSGLGSTQNQLTSTIANLSVTKINVQATESSIRDVDFAAESTTFSKMQVLMQAGTYAQSQANATSQNVMRLLQ